MDRLVELLADGSAVVRGEAALGLGGLNRKRAIAPLRERLKGEKDQRVHQLIEQAIRTIQANAGS